MYLQHTNDPHRQSVAIDAAAPSNRELEVAIAGCGKAAVQETEANPSQEKVALVS